MRLYKHSSSRQWPQKNRSIACDTIPSITLRAIVKAFGTDRINNSQHRGGSTFGSRGPKRFEKRVFEGQRHAHEGIVESIALSGATGGLWMLGEDSCEVNVDCS